MKINKLKPTILLASMLLSSSLSFAGVIEDSAITTAVKAKLLLEKDISAKSIEVTTKDNEVFLKGEVDTSLQANRAIELAASMKNVEDVNYNDLKVKASTSTATDSLTTAKVKGRISQLLNDSKIAPGYDLTAETNNGEVHIFGTVDTASDISTIENAVKKMKCVNSVKTNIQTKK